MGEGRESGTGKGRRDVHEQMCGQVHRRSLTKLMRQTLSERFDRSFRGVVRRAAATVYNASTRQRVNGKGGGVQKGKSKDVRRVRDSLFRPGVDDRGLVLLV